MDFRPRFQRHIVIVFLVLCLTVIGSTRAHAAGFGDYVAAPFESLVATFETVFSQLIALAEPHHTVTVNISPTSAASWHAEGTSATAAAINSLAVAQSPPLTPAVAVASSVASATTTASDSSSVLTVPAPSPAPQQQSASYITQDELTAQLQAATNNLRSLIYQSVSAPNSTFATGGFTNEIAASNKIDQLDGTALNNVTVNGISGLTASDIPTNIVAANYLPLSGGTITGVLSVATLTASSTNYDNFTSTNSTTTNATSTTLYAASAVIPALSGTNSSFTNATTTGNAYIAGNVRIGTTGAPTDSLEVAQSISGSGINFDDIGDRTAISPTADGAMFSSFDTEAAAGGTFNLTHLSGYQDRTYFYGSGTLSSEWSFYSNPAVDNGTLTNRYGVDILDVAGAGTVTNNYGIFINPLTRGSVGNFGIYEAGASQGGTVGATGATNYLAGKVDIGGYTHGEHPTGELTVEAPSAGLNTADTARTLMLVSTSPNGADVGAQLGLGGETGQGVTPLSFGTIAGRYEGSGYAGYLQFSTINAGGSINEAMRIASTGNVGIGTTSPFSRLSVVGPDTSGSTAAFTITNSTPTTEFQVFDNGSATLAGTLTQNSDQHLKTNISSLDASSSLASIDALNPVTFNWIDQSQGGNTQIGFIAQQVQTLFPQLVSTTSATALTPTGTLGLNYIGLISPIVSAIQALSAEITTLEK